LEAADLLLAQVVLKDPVGDDDVPSIRVLGMASADSTHRQAGGEEERVQLLGHERRSHPAHFGEPGRGDANGSLLTFEAR
jgi:hypothetical protein